MDAADVSRGQLPEKRGAGKEVSARRSSTQLHHQAGCQPKLVILYRRCLLQARREGEEMELERRGAFQSMSRPASLNSHLMALYTDLRMSIVGMEPHLEGAQSRQPHERDRAAEPSRRRVTLESRLAVG